MLSLIILFAKSGWVGLEKEGLQTNRPYEQQLIRRLTNSNRHIQSAKVLIIHNIIRIHLDVK